MAEEPDRLKRDIERTRASLTRDVDLLAEKTSPTKVAQRRWNSVKEKVMGSPNHGRHTVGGGTSSAVDSVKDKAAHLGDVAGDKVSHLGDVASEKASHLGDVASEKASHLGDVASEKAHDAADALRTAPQAVAVQTQGNPIAAGIIAFGVGMLAATLIPVSDVERRAGQQLKDNGGDLADQVKEIASDLKSDLTGPVQQAVAQVKETAQDAAQTTKDQAQTSVQGAKEQTQHAVRNAS